MKKRFIIISIAVLLLLVLGFGCYKVFGVFYPRIMDAVTENVTASVMNEIDEERYVNHYDLNNSWSDNNRLIAHAFGSIDDKTYTNSLEAFKYNYDLGYRVFEVDFYLTNDYETVCFHNERDWREKCNIADDVEFTYDNFMNSKIYEKYTTLDYKDLVDLMVEHKDIYIVTDTKYKDEEHTTIQFTQIVNYAKEVNPEVLDRIIPQIYTEKMLDYVMNVYNFKSIIYTLYQNPGWEPEHLALFCKKSGIKFVTMWDSLYSEKIIKLLDNFDVKIAIHTVNDIEVYKEFINVGGQAIYTDYIMPSNIEGE